MIDLASTLQQYGELFKDGPFTEQMKQLFECGLTKLKNELYNENMERYADYVGM